MLRRDFLTGWPRIYHICRHFSKARVRPRNPSSAKYPFEEDSHPERSRRICLSALIRQSLGQCLPHIVVDIHLDLLCYQMGKLSSRTLSQFACGRIDVDSPPHLPAIGRHYRRVQAQRLEQSRNSRQDQKREHTKPARSPSEVRSRFVRRFCRGHSLRKQTAKLSKIEQARVLASSSPSSRNVDNGKFLDAIAQRTWISSVSTISPTLLVGCNERLTEIGRTGISGQKLAASSVAESLKRMVRARPFPFQSFKGGSRCRPG